MCQTGNGDPAETRPYPIQVALMLRKLNKEGDLEGRKMPHI